MAATITVQDTINFALPYVQFRPLAIGASNEPAMTIANTVLQTILGPPFCWRWNRHVVTEFTTVAGSPEYTIPVVDFGFIEKASAAGFEMEVKNILMTISSGPDLSRPTQIAAQYDDNQGNIGFSLFPIPDDVYPIDITYQIKPPLITALINTWTPIPDEYSFVYHYGFLALASAYADDPRFLQFSQMFKGHLLGVSEGLDETQKAIFIERWDRVTGNTQATALRTQQGVQGRAL